MASGQASDVEDADMRKRTLESIFEQSMSDPDMEEQPIVDSTCFDIKKLKKVPMQYGNRKTSYYSGQMNTMYTRKNLKSTDKSPNWDNPISNFKIDPETVAAFSDNSSSEHEVED